MSTLARVELFGSGALLTFASVCGGGGGIGIGLVAFPLVNAVRQLGSSSVALASSTPFSKFIHPSLKWYVGVDSRYLEN